MSRIDEAADPADKRRWLGLLVLSLALFMASMDNTILNVALPSLARDLRATNDQLQWTVDAYQVTYAGFLLVAGSLVDRWGRTRTFTAGVIAFGICSLGAGLSGNTSLLILARAVTGVGAALLTPSTLALISVLFRKPTERTTAFAIWSAANGAGAAVGPLLSGALLAHFRWGAIFLINVPVAALCLIGVFLFIPQVAPERADESTDWLGAALSIGGLCVLCWAVISAPGLGIASPPIIVTFLAGLGLMAAFVWWQGRVREPILRLSLFGHRTFAVSVAVSGLVTGGGAGALFVLTQLLQYVLGFTPWQSGLAIMPVALTMLIGAVIAPKALRALGIKRAVLGGLLLVTLGFAWLAATPNEESFAQLLPGALFFGLGAGVLMPAATQAVMDSLPSESEGAGSATNSALMQVGSAMGVAIIGSLLAARYRGAMQTEPLVAALDPQTRDGVLASVAQAVDLTLDPRYADLLPLVKQSFVSGMRIGLGASAVAVAAATVAVIVFFPSEQDRRREQVSTP
ncbi:MFS transporter, DHA2 family, multidrug resistance protein [Propionibacterium cyclohexanicum]|uniref:MFS transporter, DHA2 family, multidrug resistance protein n=1 Tax=Propionibacterium cyclohexanicum TaxID=64702 RepID=A0A1H9TF90_9ACTN|nr:MFS transporter [Propionibacterium cyclohexanicum]SER95811.1 MFS transporter, DHA2 family, multidrug resistance protein [Propionibacterium cyclohexanicum]